MIYLRSDTDKMPTGAMREAMYRAEVGDDVFGDDPTVNRLEELACEIMGTEAALVPLSAMSDGNSVIEVNPMSPTKLYHLACERHEAIRAAGLEVESYHPGPETPLSLPAEMMQLFLRFFPHVDSIRSFGKLSVPRLTADEFQSLLG